MAQPGPNRRQFLHLAAWSAAAAASADQVLQRWITVGADGHCHPGSSVALSVSPWAPRGCSVRLVVGHGGAALSGPGVPVAPAATAHVQTPYPFDDVVPGRYTVHAELVAADDSVVARAAVGDYTVRPFRFSA